MEPDIYKHSLNPYYILLWRRLESFHDWVHNYIVSSYDLAKAGFIYTKTIDRVKCFHCNGALENWPANSVPLKEHMQWLPKCEYAKLLHKDSNLLFNMYEVLSVQAIQKLGYTNSVITTAYKTFFEKGIRDPTTLQLLEKVLQININALDIDCAYANSFDVELVNEKLMYLSVSDSEQTIIDLKHRYEVRTRIEELCQENQLLKSKIYCQNCKNRLNGIYIPCGHIICLGCEKHSSSRCHICFRLISIRRKIYTL